MKNNPKKLITMAGFTLTELMITLAIASILAAIALPAYQSSVLKSRRTEAKTELADIVAKQESYYYRNNLYSQSLTDFGYGGSGNAAQRNSKTGYYKLQIVQDGSGNCTGTPDFTCTKYYVRARPFGAQADDIWIYRHYADGRKYRCERANTTNFNCASGTGVWNWAE